MKRILLLIGLMACVVSAQLNPSFVKPNFSTHYSMDSVYSNFLESSPTCTNNGWAFFTNFDTSGGKFREKVRGDSASITGILRPKLAGDTMIGTSGWVSGDSAIPTTFGRLQAAENCSSVIIAALVKFSGDTTQSQAYWYKGDAALDKDAPFSFYTSVASGYQKGIFTFGDSTRVLTIQCKIKNIISQLDTSVFKGSVFPIIMAYDGRIADSTKCWDVIIGDRSLREFEPVAGAISAANYGVRKLCGNTQNFYIGNLVTAGATTRVKNNAKIDAVSVWTNYAMPEGMAGQNSNTQLHYRLQYLKRLAMAMARSHSTVFIGQSTSQVFYNLYDSAQYRAGKWVYGSRPTTFPSDTVPYQWYLNRLPTDIYQSENRLYKWRTSAAPVYGNAIGAATGRPVVVYGPAVDGIGLKAAVGSTIGADRWTTFDGVIYDRYITNEQLLPMPNLLQHFFTQSDGVCGVPYDTIYNAMASFQDTTEARLDKPVWFGMSLGMKTRTLSFMSGDTGTFEGTYQNNLAFYNFMKNRPRVFCDAVEYGTLYNEDMLTYNISANVAADKWLKIKAQNFKGYTRYVGGDTVQLMYCTDPILDATYYTPVAGDSFHVFTDEGCTTRVGGSDKGVIVSLKRNSYAQSHANAPTAADFARQRVKAYDFITGARESYFHPIQQHASWGLKTVHKIFVRMCQASPTITLPVSSGIYSAHSGSGDYAAVSNDSIWKSATNDTLYLRFPTAVYPPRYLYDYTKGMVINAQQRGIGDTLVKLQWTDAESLTPYPIIEMTDPVVDTVVSCYPRTIRTDSISTVAQRTITVKARGEYPITAETVLHLGALSLGKSASFTDSTVTDTVPTTVSRGYYRAWMSSADWGSYSDTLINALRVLKPLITITNPR